MKLRKDARAKARLKDRQDAFDRLPSHLKAERKRPGSMNPHKQRH